MQIFQKWAEIWGIFSKTIGWKNWQKNFECLRNWACDKFPIGLYFFFWPLLSLRIFCDMWTTKVNKSICRYIRISDVIFLTRNQKNNAGSMNVLHLNRGFGFCDLLKKRVLFQQDLLVAIWDKKNYFAWADLHPTKQCL